MNRGPGEGWTVLVTGASSGLGRALAVELARIGCRLVLTGRDAHRLASAKLEALAAGSPGVETVAVDLALPGGPEALIAQVEASGGVDALVNNAGAGWAGVWGNSSNETDRAQVRLLIEVPLALTKALLPGWRSREKGAVLNVASTGAFQPGPLTAVYYASKAFLLSWSLALAREERDLVVTILCPGALKTEFASRAGKRDVPGAPGPEKTARRAVRAWQRGRGLVVPGAFNRVMVALSRVLPLGWTAAGVEAVQRSVQGQAR